MKKSRVFIGLANTGYNASYISRSLRKIGIKATSYSYYNVSFGEKTDYSNLLFRNNRKYKFLRFFTSKINKLLKNLLFLRSLLKYDVFIFISKYTFFSKNEDLPILKFFGKKIAFIFPGCIERDPTDKINLGDNGICSKCQDIKKQDFCNCNDLIKKRNIIQHIERYSDFIFDQEDTRSFLQSTNKSHFFYVIADKPKDQMSLLQKFENVEKVNIVHFPSNVLLKGTEFVEPVITKLKSKFPNKINFISKRVAHDELLNILSQSHILIDQFNGFYGLLGVEGMAHGCVTIEYIRDSSQKKFKNLPIESITPNNLYEKLCYYIENVDKMKEIGTKSIHYFNKYHTPVAVANYYKKNLKLY